MVSWQKKFWAIERLKKHPFHETTLAIYRTQFQAPGAKLTPFLHELLCQRFFHVPGWGRSLLQEEVGE